MTSKEVFDVMQKDVERLSAFLSHKEKSLMSELRKSRREMVSQSYDYHTPNADYIIVLRCNRKGYVSRMRFAFIEETLEYVSSAIQGKSKGVVSYSVHLLRRYAERFCMIPHFRCERYSSNSVRIAYLHVSIQTRTT